MNSDIQNVLSGMLADWHIWSTHTAQRGGYPGKAACFGQSRSSSQYDWQNQIESEMVDKLVMQGFDAAIQRVRMTGQPVEGFNQNAIGLTYFTALQLEARNLAVRHQVWVSPRLPANRVEREALILEARNRLLKELAKDGVLC